MSLFSMTDYNYGANAADTEQHHFHILITQSCFIVEEVNNALGNTFNFEQAKYFA